MKDQLYSKTSAPLSDTGGPVSTPDELLLLVVVVVNAAVVVTLVVVVVNQTNRDGVVMLWFHSCWSSMAVVVGLPEWLITLTRDSRFPSGGSSRSALLFRS